MRRLAPDRVHPSSFARLRWAPDSKSVIVLLGSDRERAQAPSTSRATPSQPQDSTAAPGATVRVYRAGPRSKSDSVMRTAAGIDTITLDTASIWEWMNADLATVRVADGVVKRLVKAQPLFWYAPSPDGQWIGFSQQSAIVRAAGQAMYDYKVVPLGGGEVRTVAHHARTRYAAASWSPDGRTLAYATAGPMADGDIYLIDVANAREHKLTSAPHPRLLVEDATPLWSPDGRTLFLSWQGQLWKASVGSDMLTAINTSALGRYAGSLMRDAGGSGVYSTDGGRTIAVATLNLSTENVGYYRIDTNSGAATKLREEARQYGGSRWPALTSADGSTIVWLAEDGQHPPDLWSAGPDMATPKRLTTLNHAISNASLGKTRVIDFLGAHGEKRQGVLLYPGNYEEGKRYPLVVRVYPGPYQFANNVNTFGLDGPAGIQNMQMFASRGYAVLMPEIPQQMGTPMRDLVAGVDLAVNRVIWHGGKDYQVPPATFVRFVELWKENMYKNSVLFLAEGLHSPNPDELSEAYVEIFRFLDRH